MTIRPHSTQVSQAVATIGNFTHHPNLLPREAVHCSICGARLRRYGKLPGETRCDPCITRHTRTLTAAELHPQIRGDGYEPCPQCGGAMSTGAMMCRQCRHRTPR